MMRMEYLSCRKALLAALLIASTAAVSARQCSAQEQNTAEEKVPTSVTTSDEEIPIDHLKLLLKPLTREELIVEADGWRDLVKGKLQEIGLQQIAVKEHQAVAEETAAATAKEAADTAKVPPDVEKPAAENDKGAEAAEDRKQELVGLLPKLKEEQALLTERMSTVVDALEKKGGDVESYRQYIAAVNGIDLDVTDAATTWTLIKGWLASEQGGQRWLWNIIKFLVILAAFYFAASIVAGLVRRGATRIKDASQLLVNFLGKFVKQAVMLIGLVVGLAALEVNIGPLLAAVGAAGFVIAFALQDTLSNFASGLLILAYRPFDVGDVIEAAGISGIVDSVSLFSTHVRTFDNKVMIVPNNDIWGGTITNATASDTRRVDMVFGVGYEDDVEKAKGIMERILKEHELVLHDPGPVVRMNELADSSINFVCRPWCKTEDYWSVYWDITRTVKEEFDRNGISIPFPQRDIHVYQEKIATSSGHAPEHGRQDA